MIHKSSLINHKSILRIGVFLAVVFIFYIAPVIFSGPDGEQLAILPEIKSAEATTNKCDDITWTTGGTIDTAETAPSTDFFHGMWFRGTCNLVNGSGTPTVSGITVTVNDATGLSNMEIFTDTVSNCTTTSGWGTSFGTNATVGATTAVSGSQTITPGSFRCFYVVLDIGSGAADAQTLDISINASGDLTTGITNSGTFPLNPTGSTTISNPPAGITISGTSNGSGTVKVAVNGTPAAGSGTISGGNWSVTGVTASNGNIITAWIDGADDTAESTAVTKYAGTGTENISGMVLNTNVFSVGSDQNTSLTVADLDTSGNGYECTDDEDVMYDASTTALNVQGCSNSYSDETIQIESGDTLVIDSDETLTTDNLTITGTLTQTTTGIITATGNISSGGTFTGGSGAISAVDLTISGGTFTSTSGTMSLSGNYSNSGTFTNNSGTVTFTATDTGNTIGGTLSGTSDFSKIIFNGSGGEWTLGANLETDGASAIGVRVQAGTLKNGGFSITGNGATDTFQVDNGAFFEMSGTSAYPASFTTYTYGASSTVRYLQTNGPTVTNATYGHLELKPAGATAIILPATLTDIAGNLTIGDGTNAGAEGTTNNPSFGVAGVLTIAANATFATGTGTITLSGSGTPFVNSGTFTATTGNTINYTGTSATNITAAIYDNLSFTPGSSATYTMPGSNLTLRGNLNIGANTAITTGAGTIIFAKGGTQTWTNSGTVDDIGAVQVSANGTATTLSTSSNVSAASITVDTSQNLDITDDTLTLTGNSSPLTLSGSNTFTITSSTVVYSNTTSATVTGTTFNNLTLGVSGTPTYTLPAADITMRGNLVVTSGATVTKSASNKIIFAKGGGGTQTVTGNATNSDLGNIQISANSGNTTLELASAITFDDLTIDASQTFSQGASYKLTTTGNITVGSSGAWTNIGTGDIELGGTVANEGTITLNSNNGTQCVDGADDIVITSTGGTTRNWSGAGTFVIYNVDATNMADDGIVITAYTSTLTSTDWAVGSCGITISGTANAGDAITVAVAVNGTPAGQTGTTGSGTWEITGVTTPGAGEVIVVWFDGVADSAESTAVTKYSSGDVGGMVLNTNVLSIGSDQNQSLSVADLDTYDCNADEDVMYIASATALNVQGSGCEGGSSQSYTDETIQIESGDTLVIDSDETLTTDNLTITGTLTQTTTGVITASGNISSSGTFNGGSGAITIPVGGTFTISGGTFTSTSGTLNVNGHWTHTAGGTFAHNSGTVSNNTGCNSRTWNFNTSQTFNNLIITGSCVQGINLDSGADTAIVLGTYTNSGSNRISDGTIEARGNVVTSNPGGASTTAVLQFLVTGDQTITASNGGDLPSIYINKSSGSVSVSGDALFGGGGTAPFTLESGTFNSTSGTLTIEGNFTHTVGGTFNHNSGTVVIAARTCGNTATIDVITTETFYNLTTDPGAACNNTTTISSDDTLIVLNDFTQGNTALSTGTLEVQGNIVIDSDADGGTAPINLTGSNAQTITTAASLGSGLITINKTNNSDTVTLASNVTLGGALTVTKGTFSQGASYNLTTAGALTIGANGTFTNTGTGSLTLGGNVVNDGIITIDGNGVSCGDADVTITTGSARAWSGSGTFNLTDVDMTNQTTALSITIYSGTDTSGNSGWTWEGCGITISGTTNAGDAITVAVAVNGTPAGQTGTTGSGTWEITGVTTPGAGEVIVVWFDGVADAAESTAVTKYSSGDVGGMVLNTNVFSVGSDQNTSLSVADLDTYDCNGDEDVMYATSATSLAVQGCSNSYTDETIQIESGDTLTIDSDETLTSDNLTITGTLTQTTTGVITLTGNLSSSGTFNGGSGNITVGGGYTQTAGTFTSTSGTLQVEGAWTHTAGGSFIHNSGTVQAGSGLEPKVSVAWDVSTSEAFNNFTVNTGGGGIVAIGSGDTFNIAGTFTHTNGAINSGGASAVTLNLAGNAVINSGADGGAALMTFTGSSAQTWTDNGGNEPDGDITINKSSASNTVTLATNADWNGTSQDVTVSVGTLRTGGFNITGAGTGVFTVSNGARFEMTGASDYPASFGTYTYGATSTVRYFQTTDKTVTNATYGHLTLAPAANDVTLTLPATLNTVAGNVLIGNGTNTVIITGATNNPTINISGTFSVDSGATFITGSNPFTAGGTTVLGGGASGAFTGGSGAVTFSSTVNISDGFTFTQGAGDVTFTGALTLGNGSGGAYVAGSGDTNILANFILNAGSTFTKGTGSTIFKGGTTQTLTDNTASKQDLGDVVISASGAGGGGNDFSGDSTAVALYNFESGAHTTDSKGTNTLSLGDAAADDTTNFKQGSASADFERGTTDFYTRTDTNLSSDFPGKSGTSNKDFSIAAWVRMEEMVDGIIYAVATKYHSSNGERTYMTRVTGTGDIAEMNLGFNGGASFELVSHASDLALATWYHITWAYQESDKSWAIRVRDTDGNIVGSDATGTATLDGSGLSVDVAAFHIGGSNAGDVNPFDGNIDELVVFNRKITAEESTAIAQASFGGSGDPSTLNLASSATFSSLTIDASQTFSHNGANVLTITGDGIENNGTFTASTGEVIIAPTNTGSAVTINGSTDTTFNDFTMQTPGTQMEFKASGTYTFNGIFTMAGSATNLIYVSSDTDGVQWYVDMAGTPLVSFTAVKDSGCDEFSGVITLTNSSVNQGNNDNDCWRFISMSAVVGATESGSGGGVIRSGGGSGGGGGGTESGSGGGEVQTGGGAGGGGGGTP